MSYEIIYDRTFIKTDKYFVPLVLMGSSNCYEFIGNREVRERHWQELSFARMFSYTEKELLETVSTLCIGSGCIRYNSKDIPDMKAWMLRGIKEAETLEDVLRISGLGFLECQLIVPLKDGYDSLGISRVASNEELDAAIDTLLKLRDEHVGSYIDFRFYTRTRLKRPKKDTQGEVVAKYGSRYVAEIRNEHSLSTTSDPSKAMVFESVEEARNTIPTVWLRNIRFVSSECKKKVWGIRVGGVGSDDRYIGSISKTKLHFSPKETVSLRFKSENEAMKYIANREYIFSRFSFAEPVLLTE